MTIFSNGDLVQVGFELDLPQHKEEPMYGRVICVNAVNPQELTVLALIIQNTNSTTESLMQFGSDGKCLLAMNAGENDAKRLGDNLYHQPKQPK